MIYNLNIKTFIIFIILMISTSIINSTETVTVLPINKKQSSGIYVRKGDKLSFKATGKWRLWEKYELVDAEGHPFNAGEYGNWGILLGKIGENNPFVIGKGIEMESDYEGVLYLFPNKGKYEINNESGNLEVTIDGGIKLETYKKQLSYKAKETTFESKNKFQPTDIYVNKGETLEIYAFGEWNMWDGIYPNVNANGHDFITEEDNWGKLYGGIGSTTGQYFETFPVGEKIKYRAKESGILSFFVYLNNYETIPAGSLDIYIIGGKQASDKLIDETNENVMKGLEQEVVSKINEFREAVLLPELEINPSFSKTAYNHARYMVENGSFERNEEADKQYYTGKTLEDRLKKEGYTGKSREMFSECVGIKNCFELFIDTVYHRLRLLNPDLKYVGFASYKSTDKTINVFDFGYKSDDEEKIDWKTIIYPPDESTNIKTLWDGIESPDPFPTGTNKPLGYPITIMFKDELKKILTAELIDENGKVVNTFIISPYNDLNNKQFNAIILVPKKELDFNKRYVVSIKVLLGKDEVEEKIAWSFMTRKK